MARESQELTDNARNPFADDISGLQEFAESPHFKDMVKRTIDNVIHHVDNVVLQREHVSDRHAEMAYIYGLGVLRQDLPEELTMDFTLDAHAIIHRPDPQSGELTYSKPFVDAFEERFQDKLLGLTGRIEVTDNEIAELLAEADQSNVLDSLDSTLGDIYKDASELRQALQDLAIDLQLYLEEQRQSITSAFDKKTEAAYEIIESNQHNMNVLDQVLASLTEKKFKVIKAWVAMASAEGKAAIVDVADSFLLERALSEIDSGRLTPSKEWINEASSDRAKLDMSRSINSEIFRHVMIHASNGRFTSVSPWVVGGSDLRIRDAMYRAVDGAILDQAMAALESGDKDEAERLAGLAYGLKAQHQMKRLLGLTQDEPGV